MIKQEDVPRFVGHIRKEALRLVTLVNDIIRLSQLDEKIELEKEKVDLLKIVNEVFENLKEMAEKKDISMQIKGHTTKIFGVKKLLYDMIYNLCDNAIKYNINGGKIMLNIIDSQNKIILTVSDTGIGIPKEHIDRVFERFYRVDKSHSKETGGTGLGLSIVKHIAAYHHGKIKIQSEVYKGTVIKIELPK